MLDLKYKPKVMLHYILPPNTSGPNISMERIENSFLSNHFTFSKLIQNEKPGKLFNLRLLIKLIKQIKSFKPDIVHISGLQSAGFYAVLASRISGYHNIITTIHGSSVDAIGFNPYLKLLFRVIIEPITINLSKRFYTVSVDMSNRFNLKNKKNFVGVIHNPAPEIRSNNLQRNSYRKELGIDENKIVFCFTGRLTYDKGISFLIESIKTITDKRAIFVFIGDGAYFEIINKELSSEINNGTVLNLGKRSDVLEILKAFDVFIFPTLHENLSNSLLEACSAGLAVIATAVGGNIEVIDNELNGLLIRPQNSTDISLSVLRLLNNRNEIKTLGDAARNNMKDKFSEEMIYLKLLDLYNNILVK